jgi:ATP-dependent protease ClpP protease subunit
MKTRTLEPLFASEKEALVAPSLPARERTVRYTGNVLHATNERVLAAMGKLLEKEPAADIALLVTSPGGATGIAMNFYDSVRYVLKPALVSVATGDIDSSGMIIFLSANRRYATARTTALLHPAGRFFGNQRYTRREMASMLAEDRLKDEQYADVIADNSQGALSRADVLALMEAQKVLSPEDLLRYRLIDAILP